MFFFFCNRYLHRLMFLSYHILWRLGALLCGWLVGSTRSIMILLHHIWHSYRATVGFSRWEGWEGGRCICWLLVGSGLGVDV